MHVRVSYPGTTGLFLNDKQDVYKPLESLFRGILAVFAERMIGRFLEQKADFLYTMLPCSQRQ